MDITGTSLYTSVMELHFTPEQEAELRILAQQQGRRPEEILLDAANHVHLHDRSFYEAVQRGIEQANAGQFIEEEEMDARIEKMLGR